MFKYLILGLLVIMFSGCRIRTEGTEGTDGKVHRPSADELHNLNTL